MRTSSINFQKIKRISSEHNSREIKPNYLIDYECKNNEYHRAKIDRVLYLENAKAQTKIKINRTMQKKQIENFYQEAVINLEKYHTSHDIKNLFKELRSQFKGGFRLFEISIHRDEGVFIYTDYDPEKINYSHKYGLWYDKDNKIIPFMEAFFPGKNIFYNEKNKKWYHDQELKNELKEFSKLKKYHNYHAHAIFTRWNEATGKMIRLKLREMSKIQDLTAEILNMKRGVPNKNRRKTHYQLKEDAYIINQIKRRYKKYAIKVDKIYKLKIEELTNELELERIDNEMKLKNQRFEFVNDSIESMSKVIDDHEREILNIKKQLCNMFNLNIRENLYIDHLYENISNIINKKTINNLKINNSYVYDEEQDIDNNSQIDLNI